MKKNIKFLFILTMFLVLIINTYCFAIDMNLTMNNQTENNELEVQTNEVNTSNRACRVYKNFKIHLFKIAKTTQRKHILLQMLLRLLLLQHPIVIIFLQ